MCRQGIDDIIITLNLQDDKMRNQVSPPPCTDVDIWPIDFARWLCSTATIHIWLHVSKWHHSVAFAHWCATCVLVREVCSTRLRLGLRGPIKIIRLISIYSSLLSSSLSGLLSSISLTASITLGLGVGFSIGSSTGLASLNGCLAHLAASWFFTHTLNTSLFRSLLLLFLSTCAFSELFQMAMCSAISSFSCLLAVFCLSSC